ncbi:unnamed protein product [Peniophora sp. CBMAI 1063]|nr:unnamed protein product [Peniophora sp. CBMAI 1063]
MGVFTSSCSPRLFWPDISARVSTNSASGEQRTLRELVLEHCPSLSSPFNPVWWLFNGHMQTMYSALADFTQVDKVEYDRVFLRLKDGGTLGLDFTPPRSAGRTFSDDTPVIVVLHGLTGGSYESYVRAVLAPAITPASEGGLGYRAVVLNSRGCAGVPLTSPSLYCAGRTTDLRSALLYLQTLYPKAPLLGVGFSLGSSVLTKYLGEEGEESRLTSGLGLGVPWDLLQMNDRLNNNWFNRNVYSKALGKNCGALLMRHAAELAQWPDSYLTRILPEVVGRKTLLAVDFDELVSRVVSGPSPPWPFPSALAFYEYCSPNQYLPGVRVPYLSLDSDDDPIANGSPIDSVNPWVTLGLTAAGGHLGWFEKEEGEIRRWVRKPALEWFRLTAERVQVFKHTRPRAIIERDGWLIDAGDEEMAVTLIDGEPQVVKGSEATDGLLAGL